MASRLMAAAGYPGGRGFPASEIIYNTSEGHKRIAEFASRNWQETLGINIGATNMEWKSLLFRARSGNFALARSAWCADYPDPQNFLENFHSDSENNTEAYKNPAYDAMLDRARQEPDRKRRRSYLCAAEKALGRDLPFVPAYQYTRSVLLRPEVRGYLPQYQDHHLLRWISLERDKGGGG
jgi:oligopeptide transport system substrate-binding protein